MEIQGRTIKLAFAASTAALLLAPPCSASEDVYRKMANDFARYSAARNVRNLAVIGFARKARTSREESEYVSEKLLSSLVASGKVNLLERAQLGKVLEERRLAASGITDETEGERKRINPSDAIIVGTIFGTRDKLKIIAKMIDPLTGEVLHTVEAQADRQWELMPDDPDFQFEVPDLRSLAEMFRDEDIQPQPVDFRDAPADLGTETCNARRARLAAMQKAALAAKAKYWAIKMRDPSFSSAGLRRNPGGEIMDKEDRKKFYAMLSDLHRSPVPVEVSVPEMNAVIKLMEEEERVSDDCGLH